MKLLWGCASCGRAGVVSYAVLWGCASCGRAGVVSYAVLWGCASCGRAGVVSYAVLWGGPWLAFLDPKNEYGGSRDIYPLIFSSGTRWRWLVNLTPRPVDPRGKNRWCILNRRQGGPLSPVWTLRIRETSLPRPGIEPRTVQPVAYSLSRQRYQDLPWRLYYVTKWLPAVHFTNYSVLSRAFFITCIVNVLQILTAPAKAQFYYYVFHV